MAQEEEKWAAELDSAETHKKRLEKNVKQGCEAAEEELKAAQQQWASVFLRHSSQYMPPFHLTSLVF